MSNTADLADNMPITVLAEPELSKVNEAQAVDIVAVHGLLEPSITTWTEPRTKTLWLRDIYPYKSLHSRILLYDYDVDIFRIQPGGSNAQLLDWANTFLAELYALRADTNTRTRPIILICHGVGGLLVKRALALSETERAPKVHHLRAIYVSTYAILFMGTPHAGIKVHDAATDTDISAFSERSKMIRHVSELFSPIMNDFCIYNFYPEPRMMQDSQHAFHMEAESAAPPWENVERCGLSANYTNMVKFGHAGSYGYQLVQEALQRYSKGAPEHIRTRWQAAESLLRLLEANHNSEHQPVIDDVPTNDSFATDFNKWFPVMRKPTSFFTGREAHSRNVKNRFLAAQGQAGRANHAIFVVYGLGGSGKTEFCLKYAHDQRSRYWGVFWVDASTNENAETGFAMIDQQVRGGGSHSTSASYSAAMHWLMQCKKPWLLILDNADDPEMDLSRFIPAGNQGHILVTTRNPSVVEHATIGSAKFHGMDPEEAVRLLLKASAPLDKPPSPNLQSWNLAERIATELGYLALPLAQAGASIRHRIYTLERYLHHYLGHKRVMLSSSRIRNTENANIITTWEIPFQQIANRPSTPYRDAADLLHLFAFMHFGSIPEMIFRKARNAIDELQCNSSMFPELLQPANGVDFQARLGEAILVLSSYSIVDHEATSRAFILHPVVHSWARERLSDAEQRRWLTCTVSVIALAISPKLEASGRSFRQLLIPHIDSCLQMLKQYLPRFPESTRHATEIEKFAWVYAENGQWETARDLQVKVIKLRTNSLGRWHRDTISAKRQLGFTYWNLFDFKPLIQLQLWILFALWFMRPSMVCWLSLTAWKPDHVSYCLALDDLTQSLWLVGKRERSKQVGQRAVDGLVKHLGAQDPKTLTAKFNLARTYMHLGDIEKSRELLLYVLKMRKRFFGMNHFDTLMARNELGILLCAQQRNLHLAERIVSNVLETRRKLLGEEHAYTLWSVNDLSKVKCERGHPAEAAVMLQRIIPIVSRTLGDKHVGMSMTKSNLAKALALCEEWALAGELLSGLLENIPSDHPDWVHAKYGYVRMQARLGHLDEVEVLCKDLLDQTLRRKILASNDPRTIAVAEELFKVYRAQNRLLDIQKLKQRIPALDENNLVGNAFDVSAVRKSSQARSSDLSQLAGRPQGYDTAGQSQQTQPCDKPEYTYSSLGSDYAFRIMELLPGERSEPLVFRLRAADWREQTQYEALSYAWGDASHKSMSICDDKHLLIPQNLRDCLLRLRRTNISRFLWADAICIDQHNLQERGQQVSVMRQIYKNATKVVVWLGEDEDGNAAKAVTFMESLTDELCNGSLTTASSMTDMDDLYQLTNRSVLSQVDASWLPVAWYFSRSWFHRLWVFQEVNSGTKIFVCCGDTHTTWDVVALTATYIKRWPGLIEDNPGLDQSFWYNAYIMRSRRHHATMSAAFMLSQGRDFASSDPLDRIYALLGTLPLRKWEGSLRPDYQLSKQDLYLDTASRCLVEDGDPFLLSCAQHNDSEQLTSRDTPTWVPQWDRPRLQVPIGVPKAGWCSSGKLPLVAQLTNSGAVLRIQGIIHDTVSRKSDVDPASLFYAHKEQEESSTDEDHPFLKLWHDQRTRLAPFHKTLEDVICAFARTFALDYRFSFGKEYQNRLTPDFIAYIKYLIDTTEDDKDRYLELRSACMSIHSDASAGNWKTYSREARSTTYGRALINTTEGSIGLASNATQVGDVVAILFGCKVPYILRPMGEHFLFVGEAYVHGIMDGEAMIKVQSGELETKNFIIH